MTAFAANTNPNNAGYPSVRDRQVPRRSRVGFFYRVRIYDTASLNCSEACALGFAEKPSLRLPSEFMLDQSGGNDSLRDIVLRQVTKQHIGVQPDQGSVKRTWTSLLACVVERALPPRSLRCPSESLSDCATVVHWPSGTARVLVVV
jgi:hypothetical protein